MKKPAIFLCLLLIISIFSLSTATGKGNDTEKTIALSKFHTIDFQATHSKLYITQGKEQKVTVSIDEDHASSLHTDVNKGVLTIYLDGNNSAADLEVYITVETLKSICLAGNNSDITSNGTIKTDELGITNITNGDISLSLDANKINTETTSSGSIILTGKTKKHNINITGSGDVKAFELSSDYTVVNIMGSGTSEVTVNKELTAEIMGSGDVIYKGKGTVKTEKMGSGKCYKSE